MLFGLLKIIPNINKIAPIPTVFLTVNGKGDSDIMPIEEYEREQRLKKVNALLQEAEEDFKNGKTISHEDTSKEIYQMLNALKGKQNEL